MFIVRGYTVERTGSHWRLGHKRYARGHKREEMRETTLDG